MGFSTSDSKEIVCGHRCPTKHAVCVLDWPHKGKEHMYWSALRVINSLAGTFTPQTFHTPIAGSA